ncbi:hypothetical protein [Desulfocurvibacter africanus]|uniref:hypothetical protein n=1 Tax=Desulfocurvibacter africanus TaxID=873 RepID=UPI000345FDB8|nr:hypothetical protein [Desulfocurvibacter africanus]
MRGWEMPKGVHGDVNFGAILARCSIISCSSSTLVVGTQCAAVQDGGAWLDLAPGVKPKNLEQIVRHDLDVLGGEVQRCVCW